MSAGRRAVRGLVVAGPHSGVGKTTITLGLIAAWRRRGLTVQPFKVGPDFIDPGHHTQAAALAARTLDGWMLPREENLRIFRRQAAVADVALVEGVMGLFDGFDGQSEAGSTAQIAKWLKLPVLLVVDARSMARSAAALVYGFAAFDPGLSLAGVVFNRVAGPSHLNYLRQAMASLPGIPCFGGLPREAELGIPERHLGLATAEDHPLSGAYLEKLAHLMEEHVDLAGLWDALPEIRPEPAPELAPGTGDVRLAVARDRAFCFYYPDNLEWLRHFGAELVPFSPLTDPCLPPDVHGLYLGGGYPELAARELAANHALRQDLRAKAQAGLPIYAECGGLMYLGEEIQDGDGHRHAMAGLLPLCFRLLPRLKALGYREVTLMADSLLGPAGTVLRGHEFHYSEIVSDTGATPRAYRLSPRRGGRPQVEGYAAGNILASYVHVHFGSNPAAARSFVAACRDFKNRTPVRPPLAGGRKGQGTREGFPAPPPAEEG